MNIEQSRVYSVSVDGVFFTEARRPPRFHRCKPQTMTVVDGREVDRCACGGIRIDGGGWSERNSARKKFRTALDRAAWITRGVEDRPANINEWIDRRRK